jgi:putative molybdopterin biosynthesis protein
MRVVVGRVGNDVLAAPLSRGAGVITSWCARMAWWSYRAASRIGSRLHRARAPLSPGEIERTIFAIGSHDMTLDLMAQFLAPRQRRMVSANVGSLGGLVALRREVAPGGLSPARSGER